MRKPKIPNGPLFVRDGSWFYVSARHLEALQERNGVITHAKIPWGQIMRQAEKCGRWDAKQGLWFPRKKEPSHV